ncbi:class I SAM-dependent methyltransferase [Breoghania sp. L-A4]|uniref:class I SAM-dependent methyltransferase n=1 Tax=Breoghania sp. L-A4 TaxID=2304600 RepID=UPI000E35E369|nr:class I SAM-dependent methyltransferase [Breoghania sp. L-A4]AXS39835.1 class I SAM-dependent methyltransferase [Breoghania sp. L-A4]
MSDEIAFEEINEAKFNMDHIYNQADPRGYFRELRKYGYAIPGAAQPVFDTLVRHLRARRRHTIRVLDLGCSYGVNAALLKYDLSLPQLYDHWSASASDPARSDEVVRTDRRFFDTLGVNSDIEVIGLDQAEKAVGYASKAGLLDEGLAINLETDPLPEAARAELSAVDLVTSTGCIGYVTEKTFARLLPVITEGEKPWLANFVLRMFPFDAIEEEIAEWGYVTEKLPERTFVQRRFASQEETDQVLETLRSLDIDPTPEEKTGNLLAEFYLSRPREEAEAMPIERLISL